MGGNSEILNDAHSVCHCVCFFAIAIFGGIFESTISAGSPESPNQTNFRENRIKTSFSTFSRSENILNLRTRAMALGLVSRALFFD